MCAKGIRHPIIERLGGDIEYVTNDISIGLDITADELRMELMFPADEPSRALLLARAAVD